MAETISKELKEVKRLDFKINIENCKKEFSNLTK